MQQYILRGVVGGVVPAVPVAVPADGGVGAAAGQLGPAVDGRLFGRDMRHGCPFKRLPLGSNARVLVLIYLYSFLLDLFDKTWPLIHYH